VSAFSYSHAAVQTEEDKGSLTMPLLGKALERFGYDDFRSEQREAFEALVESRKLLFVAPTGSGKSLVYQLPASELEGMTIIVSPLIALMHDQVESLKSLGVEATYLASSLSEIEYNYRKAKIEAGSYRLVYVAPERLTKRSFRAWLRGQQVSMIAIDEAHCISQWGHDFRPEYLRLAEVIEELNPHYILACTATATAQVRKDIVGRLGLSADTPLVIRGFSRPNLGINIYEEKNSKEQRRLVRLLLKRIEKRPGVMSGASILYVRTRKGCEDWIDCLREEGIQAHAYHAGLSPSAREELSQNFRKGSTSVVVATSAFGMGIDRPDVRLVVHIGPPPSLEAYYQEIGRAGRDGKPAQAAMFVTTADMSRQSMRIERECIEQGISRNYHRQKWGQFLELFRWLDQSGCRHDGLLSYFDDEGKKSEGCGRCDRCEGLNHPLCVSEGELRIRVQKALSAVARIHGYFGLGVAKDLLNGKATVRIRSAGLENTSTFGCLADHSERWIRGLLRRCIARGWISFHGHEKPLVALSSEGIEVMKGAVPSDFLLPPGK